MAVETRIGSNEQAMVLFIQFIEESHAKDIGRQNAEFARLLLCILSGSWGFPQEFKRWRAERGV